MKFESNDLEYFNVEPQCFFCRTTGNMKTVIQETEVPNTNKTESYLVRCKNVGSWTETSAYEGRKNRQTFRANIRK
jgi:hypothetical protein